MKISSKNIPIPFLFMAIFMIALSCSKDKDDTKTKASNCDNVTCLNGGECVDGTCDCPPGYSGADCGQFNSDGGGGEACDGVSCENGGYCIDGTCVCPQGYQGVECQDQIEPSVIRITSIKVSDLPEADFQNWDYAEDNSGPDIYIQILYGNGDLIYTSDVIYNVDITDDYTFVFSPPVEINEVEGTHIFRLKDEDPGEDDQLGGVQTNGLYNSSNGFPAYINTGGGNLNFRVNMEYVW